MESILHHLKQATSIQHDDHGSCKLLTWHSEKRQVHVCNVKAGNRTTRFQHIKTAHKAELYDTAASLQSLAQSVASVCPLCKDCNLATHDSLCQHLLAEHWEQLQVLAACVYKLHQHGRCMVCSHTTGGQPHTARVHVLDHHLDMCIQISSTISSIVSAAQPGGSAATRCMCPYSSRCQDISGTLQQQFAGWSPCDASAMSRQALYCHLLQTHWHHLLAQHTEQSASVSSSVTTYEPQHATSRTRTTPKTSTAAALASAASDRTVAAVKERVGTHPPRSQSSSPRSPSGSLTSTRLSLEDARRRTNLDVRRSSIENRRSSLESTTSPTSPAQRVARQGAAAGATAAAAGKGTARHVTAGAVTSHNDVRGPGSEPTQQVQPGMLQRQPSMKLWTESSDGDELLPSENEVEAWLCAFEPQMDASPAATEMLPTEDEVEAWLRSAELQPLSPDTLQGAPDPAWHLPDIEGSEYEGLALAEDATQVLHHITGPGTASCQEPSAVHPPKEWHPAVCQTAVQSTDGDQVSAAEHRCEYRSMEGLTHYQLHSALSGKAVKHTSLLQLTASNASEVICASFACSTPTSEGAVTRTQQQLDADADDADSVYTCDSASGVDDSVVPCSQQTSLLGRPSASSLVPELEASLLTAESVCDMVSPPCPCDVTSQPPYTHNQPGSVCTAVDAHTSKVGIAPALTSSGPLLTSLAEDGVNAVMDASGSCKEADRKVAFAVQDTQQRQVRRISSANVSRRQTRQDSHLSTATSFHTAHSREELPSM